jgi:hypothetical protein
MSSEQRIPRDHSSPWELAWFPERQRNVNVDFEYIGLETVLEWAKKEGNTNNHHVE